MTDKKEQHYIDKSEWGNGVWKNEPDRVSWIDPTTNYHCLIKRNQFGTLCGYVAVGKNHPYYEKDDRCLNVHGSITFTDHCQGDPEKGICHLTPDDDDAWWFGFDCGHAGDYSPGVPLPYESGFRDIYRDIPYVTAEVESLAKQLKDVEKEL